MVAFMRASTSLNRFASAYALENDAYLSKQWAPTFNGIRRRIVERWHVSVSV